MSGREYQPKTGAACTCKRGVQRDNCPTCEGTGWVIDFRAIRAATSGGECPYCRRIMSNREKAEQGACNDCHAGVRP